MEKLQGFADVMSDFLSAHWEKFSQWWEQLEQHNEANLMKHVINNKKKYVCIFAYS